MGYRKEQSKEYVLTGISGKYIRKGKEVITNTNRTEETKFVTKVKEKT